MKGKMMTLYKILNEDGSGLQYSGDFQWGLPHNEQPGEWTPPITGELIPRGYSLCRPSDLIYWIGPALFEAEYRGERIDAGNKIVVREARLLRRIQTANPRNWRILACDYAEHVLHIFESLYPDDNRPRQAIETARRFANDEASAEEMAAARAAARDTGRDVTRSAACISAWAAAGIAAWAAARDAARAAAGVVAWAATRDAARAATNGSITSVATKYAAIDAARTSARYTERHWQTQHSLEVLELPSCS